MKTILLTLTLTGFALAGCVETSPTQNTMLGALGGAAAGAALSSKSDQGKGALIGAALGAAAASQVKPKNTTSNQCLYRDSTGRTFYAAC